MYKQPWLLLKMLLILGLCAKDYLIDFSDYNQYVDGCVYLYSDPSIKDIPVKNTFSYQFHLNNDFSEMRNYCLEKIEKHFGHCNVIMPDDSFEIHDLKKEELDNSDSFLLKVIDQHHTYYCRKIFKSHLRFKGAIREQISYRTEKLINGYFFDRLVNLERSLDRSMIPNQEKEFFLQNHYLLLNQPTKALEQIDLCLKHSFNKEMKFICLMNKAILTRNPNYILEASKMYPPRRKEALIRYCQVIDQGDLIKKIKKEIINDKKPFVHLLPVSNDILELIKNL